MQKHKCLSRSGATRHSRTALKLPVGPSLHMMLQLVFGSPACRCTHVRKRMKALQHIHADANSYWTASVSSTWCRTLIDKIAKKVEHSWLEKLYIAMHVLEKTEVDAMPCIARYSFILFIYVSFYGLYEYRSMIKELKPCAIWSRQPYACKSMIKGPKPHRFFPWKPYGVETRSCSSMRWSFACPCEVE